MIARVIALTCLLVAQQVLGDDRRSDLKLAAGHRRPGGPAWFVISAPAHKHVLVSIKDAKITTLAVSAGFPYSVSVTESPTARYMTVICFSDEVKGALIDSFGITSSDDLECTDADTHQRLVESTAQGNAIGEKVAKELWGEHH